MAINHTIENEDIPEIVGDSKHLKHLYKDIMKNMMINLSS